MAKHTDPITKRLGENIFLARKIFSLSQVKLATKIGVDPDTVRNWEACRRKPDHDIIVKMAAVLGLGEAPDPWEWFYLQHPQERAQLSLVPGTGSNIKPASDRDRILDAMVQEWIRQNGTDDGSLTVCGHKIAARFNTTSKSFRTLLATRLERAKNAIA
jgi:transcriptional regulator with XRE-family HTH domain